MKATDIFSSTTASLTSLLQTITTRVYPLCAVAGTKIPFIIYRRTNSQPLSFTKDGMSGIRMSFDIELVTESYTDGLTLLDALHVALVHRYPEFQIVNTGELFDSDQNLYIQQISITIDVNN